MQYYMLINIFILIYLLFPISTSTISKIITIKIKGTGRQQIFNSEFSNSNIPNVYFHGELMTMTDNYEIDITGTEIENEITLIWDSENINCKDMFNGLTNIIEVDLSNFYPSYCSTMRNMFNGMINLININMNDFDTSNCNDMNHMFSNCISLKSLDFSSFDTSKVTNMESMFLNCSSLTSLNISNFDTSRVSNMINLFGECSSLSLLYINNLKTNEITSMNKMFKGCSSLISLNLNHFDTIKVTTMSSLFEGCSSLVKLEINNFGTSEVTNMANMFSKCENLTSLDVSNFDTSKVNNMKNMFTNCRLLTSIDVSNFNTSQVTNMNKMFDSCNSLLTINLTNFNTQSVTDIGKMFSGCKSLVSIDLSNFNTASLTIIDQIFSNCQSLKSINLNNFNTTSVTNMEKMFYNCISLTSLDLSSFNTLNVINMKSMFENCINLEYINILNYEENANLDITNIFSYTGDFVYCVNVETNVKILSELNQKICITYDCDSNWLENKNILLEAKKNDLSILNDQCIYKTVKIMSEDFYISNGKSNTTIYSYEIDSTSDEIKNKYTNITYIEFSQKDIDYIYQYFGLDQEKDKLYILMADMLSNDSRKSTSDYDFIIVLENGTQLNLSNINIDIYFDVSVPIRDLDLANFNYAQYYQNLGYDIYNSSSEFYNDICSPASYGDDDLILKDRQTDIYPNNVTFCNDNCVYKSVNIEEQRIICECNLNTNSSNEDENSEDFLNEEDNGNYFSYFVDNINYKILKCYKLFNLENLKNSFAFFVLCGVFGIILFLCILFLFFGLSNIRIQMHKNMPTDQKIRELIIAELKKRKEVNKRLNLSKKNVKFKEGLVINKNKNNEIKNTKLIKNKNIIKSNCSSRNITELLKKKKVSKKEIRFITINSENNFKNKIQITESRRKLEQIKKDNSEDYNIMPYTQALRSDKRSIFQVFKSILINKLELVNLIINDNRIRIICINEYILSLLFDFFFNALLYSDDVVSHKYHNNGRLDFVVSFSISIVSNIITSIVCHFFQYSNGIERRLDEISEIKKEYKFLYALKKFFLFLKYRMVFFTIIEIIIVGVCFYYIVLFSIIYKKSQLSLFINYLYSLLEGLIKSLAFTFAIVITRQIGIYCSNSYLYNTSKYLNDKF